MVFKAIGQRFDADAITDKSAEIDIAKGRITVDENRKCNLDNVWAGGDCVVGGEDLTVGAVEDGKIAAEAINKYLGFKPGAR